MSAKLTDAERMTIFNARQQSRPLTTRPSDEECHG